MQLYAPIFPKESTLISNTVAVQQKDDMVHYFANGLPVFCHGLEEQGAFRHIICLLVEQGLCRRIEIVRCFGISDDFVGKSLRMFRNEGVDALYRPTKTRSANKVVGEKRKRIQSKLDKGQSVNSIAKEESINEGAIRYQVKIGNLKKKLPESL